MARTVGVACAVAASLAAVLLSVALGPPTFAEGSLLDRMRLPGDPVPAPETGGPVTEGTQPAEVPAPVLGVPVEVLLGVLVTSVAVALLVRSLLRARGEAAVDEPGPDLLDDPAGRPVDVAGLRDAVRQAALGLDDTEGRDAADVVVGCWVRLEVAGGAVGSGRRSTDTPTEFALRLQQAVPGLDTGALLRLRSVYSRVRFGANGASAADVDVARAALGQLLATLDPTVAAGRTGLRA